MKKNHFFLIALIIMAVAFIISGMTHKKELTTFSKKEQWSSNSVIVPKDHSGERWKLDSVLVQKQDENWFKPKLLITNKITFLTSDISREYNNGTVTQNEKMIVCGLKEPLRFYQQTINDDISQLRLSGTPKIEIFNGKSLIIISTAKTKPDKFGIVFSTTCRLFYSPLKKV